MATWNSANFSALIPSELEALIDTAETTAGTVADLLGGLETAIDAIKTFLIPIPSFDLAGALITAVEQFREDFLGSGYYGLNMWDYPLAQYYRSGYAGESFIDSFETDVVNSFADVNDPNVPPFSGDVAMLILVGGAPGLGALIPLFERMSTAFTWWGELGSSFDTLVRVVDEASVKAVQQLIALGDIKFDTHPSRQTLALQKLKKAERMLRDNRSSIDKGTYASLIKPYVPTEESTPQEILEFVAAVESVVTPSAYPDWQRMSLRTIIQPLPDIVDQVFDPLIAALQTGRSIVDAIESFLDALAAKIAALNSVIIRIEEYLARLDDLISATGMYALFVTSSSGTAGLAREILSASDKPFEAVGDGFYFGVSFLAGGPSLAPFKNLFQPIGSP